jgi:hypothetical protein
MKSLLTTLIVLFALNSANAQSFGFNGKKNFVSLDGIFRAPALYYYFGLELEAYQPVDGALEKGLIKMDRGLSFTAGRLLKKNVAVLLSYESQSYQFVPLGYSAVDDDGLNFYDFQSSTVWATRTQIMPIIEFSTTSGSLPAGISTQIGFGFAKTKLTDKEALVDLEQFGETQTTLDQTVMYDQDMEPVKMFSLMFRPTYRFPITTSIMANIGLSYSLNFTREISTFINGSDSELTSHLYQRDGMVEAMARRELMSPSSLYFGLTYAF